VAGRQGHDLQVGRVPGAQDDAAVVGRVAQLPDDVGELVDALARVVGVRVDVARAEVPPLEAVDGAEVALGAPGEPDAVEVRAAAVAVPDLDAGRGEGERRRRAADEPQELGEDGAQEDALCREQGEEGEAGGAGEREFEGWGREEGERACAGAGGGQRGVAAGEKGGGGGRTGRVCVRRCPGCRG